MPKVLIVDDDPDVVESVQLYLQKEGIDMVAAYSKDEGLNKVGGEAFDLLILDVMMESPDDGIAMAQQLRKGGFAAPIVMMTSIGRVTGMEYDKDDSLVPVNAFLEKPVSPNQLVKTVKELLAGKEV